nr:NAD(P)H-hydrate dehydratase [Candidatus Sigynarchaeota archaeon]
MDLHAFMQKFHPQVTMIADDMYVLDEDSEDLGITKDKLMENAGAAVANDIAKHFGPIGQKSVRVFCGLGNNGGDGLVVARHLAREARSVTIYLLGDPGQITTPEAASNWSIVARQPYSIQTQVIKDSSQLSSIKDIDKDTIIVDALLGAGIKGDVREPVASCIRMINTASETRGCPVIAVDVPSGCNMDDGTVANVHIKATRTVTFHLPKQGLVNKPDITGPVDVFPIGIPPEADWLVGKGDVKLAFKKRRDARSVKGMNGKVLVIGGSKQYSGAPILSALAASRSGVDLVNLCIPEIHSIVARSASPDLIVTPLEGQNITEKNRQELESRVQWADTVLIGPGMGREPETARAIVAACDFAVKSGKKLVIDADGLKAISSSLATIDSPNVIITPHAGEFSIVSGTSTDMLKTLDNRLDAAYDFTRKTRCQLIMKGPEDIVMNRDRCKINLVHTPAMTVGGTGDVLAGLAAALASLYGISTDRMFTVACAAIHVNGLIGNLVERQKGGPFITASMMIDNIGTILSKFAK